MKYTLHGHSLDADGVSSDGRSREERQRYKQGENKDTQTLTKYVLNDEK